MDEKTVSDPQKSLLELSLAGTFYEENCCSFALLYACYFVSAADCCIWSNSYQIVRKSDAILPLCLFYIIYFTLSVHLNFLFHVVSYRVSNVFFMDMMVHH